MFCHWLCALMERRSFGSGVCYLTSLARLIRFTFCWPVPRYDYSYFMSFGSIKFISYLPLSLAGPEVLACTFPYSVYPHKTLLLYLLYFSFSLSFLYFYVMLRFLLAPAFSSRFYLHSFGFHEWSSFQPLFLIIFFCIFHFHSCVFLCFGSELDWSSALAR